MLLPCPQKLGKRGSVLNSLCFLSGILLWLILFSCKTDKADKRIKEIEHYHFQNGSKGPVCWRLEGERDEEKKSIDLYVNICPKFGEKKYNRIRLDNVSNLEEAKKTLEYFSSAIFKGDRCMLILPGKGFRAYDIYTGEQLETEKNIMSRFPQLKDGISEVDYHDNSFVFLKVRDARQGEFYYDTEQQLLFPRQQKKWVDSLIRNETAGLQFIPDSSGNEILLVDDKKNSYARSKKPGRIIGLPSMVFAVYRADERSRVVIVKGFPFAMESFGKSLSAALGEIKSDEELNALDFNFNNGVLCIYSNGKTKFGAGYSVAEGKELWKVRPDTLF